MKKITLVALLMVLFCGTTLSAKSFDWSKCWCNYGGGIKEKDIIVNIDAVLYYSDISNSKYDGFWFVPPVLVEVQYAKKIWELPFTFGGYAGIRACGYDYDIWDTANNKFVSREAKYLGLMLGGEIAYHMQFPPEGLDLYAVTRLGTNIPFSKSGQGWKSPYVDFGAACGANWFFGDFFGVNLEFGHPYTKIGVTLKF